MMNKEILTFYPLLDNERISFSEDAITINSKKDDDPNDHNNIIDFSEIESGVYKKYNGNLSCVVLPNDVFSIGDMAFSNNPNIKKVVLPETVTKIGDKAFWQCPNLEEVIVMGNLTLIGEEVFRECPSLKYIDISDKSHKYCSVNGVLFNKEMTVLYKFPAKNKMALDDTGYAYTIPRTVLKIGEYAFESCNVPIKNAYDSSIQRIEVGGFINSQCLYVYMPTGLKNIGPMCFYKSELTEINLPNTIEVIENYAFAFSHIKKIELPNSIQEIGKEVFSGSNLQEAVIEDGITSLPERLFMDARELREVTLPESIEKISENCFSGCRGLEKIKLPKSLKDIGMSAFSFCTLKSITLNQYDIHLDDNAFDWCYSLEEIYICTENIRFGNKVMGDCKNKNSITVYSQNNPIAKMFAEKNGLKYSDFFEITDGVLSSYNKCRYLDKIVIPDSAKIIGEYVFSEFKNVLNDITMMRLAAIKAAFSVDEEKKTVAITIPESIVEIRNNAFRYFSLFNPNMEIETIIIPNTVKTISSNAFDGNDTEKFNIIDCTQNKSTKEKKRIHKNFYKQLKKLNKKIADEYAAIYNVFRI